MCARTAQRRYNGPQYEGLRFGRAGVSTACPAARRLIEGAEIIRKSSYLPKLPTSLQTAAQRLAKQDGVSVNQWIAVAIAQKIGVVETVADFLRARSVAG